MNVLIAPNAQMPNPGMPEIPGTTDLPDSPGTQGPMDPEPDGYPGLMPETPAPEPSSMPAIDKI